MAEIYDFPSGELIYKDKEVSEEERSIMDMTFGEVIEILESRYHQGYKPMYYVVSKDGILIEEEI